MKSPIIATHPTGSPDTAPLVELTDVSRVFEGDSATPVRALDGISLRINAGEFVCITGSSGSGKSTLMNIIGCLDRATAGDCCVLGSDVATFDDDGLAELRRDTFGFVFQSYNLLDSLTALENVELPAGYAGRPGKDQERRARETLGALGLEQRLGHRPAELSGGEQQRVAIARALINGARMILADEPTGALDSEQAGELLDLLEALADRGHAVIVASHDRTVASRARRVVELRDGRVVRDSGAVPVREVEAREAQPGRSGGIPWRTALRGGLASLRASRMRAALTVSSIALGTWSVLALLGLAEGVGLDLAASMERMGTNRLTVGRLAMVGGSFERLPLTMADAEAIGDEVDNISTLLPGLWERLPVSGGSESIDEVIVRAKSDLEPRTTQNVYWPLEQGSYLTRRDGETGAQVAVIGPTVRKRLFAPDQDPMGAHIQIDGRPFLVKGVLTDHPRQEGEGESFWSGPTAYEWIGTVIHIPFQTGADVLFGKENLSGLDILVTDVERIDETAADIKDVLFRRHGKDGYTVQNDAVIWTSGKKLKAVHIAIFGTIAVVAILVGGMGIMAVTLASVRQRTREIGIRMAVGARRRDITAQFLVETVVATTLGGVIGALLGFAGSPLLSHLTDAPVAFAPWFVPVALGCAVAAGLLFGIVPARRASRLDPVAALSTD